MFLAVFALPASAANATSLVNISVTEQSPVAGTNATYTMNLTNNGTSGGDSYNLTITNGNSASIAGINVTSPIYIEQDASLIFELNVTNTVAGVFYVNVTATSVNDSTKNMSVNTTTSPYDLPSITGFAPAVSVTDTAAAITRAFNVTVNQSVTTITWYINGTQAQQNTSVSSASYTNSSAQFGTWNVTAIATNGAGSASKTWTWSVPLSTLSGLALVTNGSSVDRVPTSINGSMNFSFADTGNITTINITLPSTYSFGGVGADNISTSLGTCTVTLTSTVISCYNATSQNNTNHYINISGRLKTPSTSATNTITVTTNKNTTGMTVTQYTRDITKPFYITANNSVFTVASESFDTTSETITLTGTGSSNLTFYVANITGQTNITVGFGATNVTVIKSRYSGTINGIPNLNTIYIETNPSVTNPVITISAVNEMESGNLPAVILVTGTVTGLAIVYAYLRRRRRH